MTPDLDRTTKDYSEPLIMARKYLLKYEQAMLAKRYDTARSWALAAELLIEDLKSVAKAKDTERANP